MDASAIAFSTESSTPMIGFSVGEDRNSFCKLATSLAEVRSLEGVVGYILRSDSAAIIDMPKEMALADFALLTYQISVSTVEIAKQFNLTNIENVLVEGKDLKVLCFTFGENKVDVFLTKTALYSSILKRIRL